MNKKDIKIHISSFVIISLFILIPLIVSGQTIETQEDLFEVITNITLFAYRIFALITVMFFLYAGFTYFTAAGNPTKLEKANKMILYGIIGLSVAILSWGMSELVESFLDPETFTNIINLYLS